jgi:NhaP-type Na+/H+ or K+/H+ antiporter
MEGIVPFSGLLAVIAMCAMLYSHHSVCAKRLSVKYNKLWLAAEVFLFALVGAEVDIRFAIKAGVMILAVMGLAMVLRLLGVYLCVLGTKLNYKERMFCMIAYIPKATVQAAIGATPLSIGLSCGQMVLTAAVLSILAAAPIGALLIDCLYCRLLQKPE